MASPPLLVKPETGDILEFYLAVSSKAVSAVLVKEVDGVQRPIYYVSKILLEAETRYKFIEKVALALVTSACKLRPYFHAHSITVLTDQPLKKILSKPDISGRVINWAIELGEIDLSYKPRTAIEAQALADFLIESSPQEEQVTDNSAPEEPSRPWTLFVDGASNKTQCGAGFILTSPDGFEIRCALRFMFQVSNNAAEYEVLIAGLRLAKAVMARRVEASNDS